MTTGAEAAGALPRFALRYRIGWRDALAWEVLPQEMTGMRKAAYLGGLFASGMALGLAEDWAPGWFTDLAPLLRLLVAVLAFHVLWILGSNLLLRLRARRALPRPMLCRFEDWGDHVYFQSESEEVSLSPDLCRQAILTETHLFFDFIGTLVIVPRAAFPSPEEAAAFHQVWLARMVPDDTAG